MKCSQSSSARDRGHEGISGCQIHSCCQILHFRLAAFILCLSMVNTCFVFFRSAECDSIPPPLGNNAGLKKHFKRLEHSVLVATKNVLISDDPLIFGPHPLGKTFGSSICAESVGKHLNLCAITNVSKTTLIYMTKCSDFCPPFHGICFLIRINSIKSIRWAQIKVFRELWTAAFGRTMWQTLATN